MAEGLVNDENFCGAPIVAVTSYAMVGDKEKALSAGCVGYIEKPIDPGTFIETISQYMAARAGEKG